MQRLAQLTGQRIAACCQLRADCRILRVTQQAGAHRLVEQAQTDFMDFAIIGDAEATIEDGILTLRVDLRPPDARD